VRFGKIAARSPAARPHPGPGRRQGPVVKKEMVIDDEAVHFPAALAVHLRDETAVPLLGTSTAVATLGCRASSFCTTACSQAGQAFQPRSIRRSPSRVLSIRRSAVLLNLLKPAMTR